MDNDPLVLYIIVREELNMSPGKVAAQVGHLVQKVLMKYFAIQVLSSKKNLNLVSDAEVEHAKLTTEWMEKASGKIVLRANHNDWEDLLKEYSGCFVIIDAGKTELEPNTKTVLGLWPQHKSQASSSIKKLRLY